MNPKVVGAMLMVAWSGELATDSAKLAPPAVIAVPKEFGERQCDAGRSSATNYRYSFRNGWRICLEQRANGEPCPALHGNGWLSNVKGYLHGNAAADQKYLELEKAVGVTRAKRAAASQAKALERFRIGTNDPNDVCVPRYPSEPKS